ncbi:ABC transporter ATP-binding protein [Schinkia azotoformans]|uniref:Cobalt ABC transporter ATP-binding protein n=1 Tax=Schinkia azotoformans LMG 9581 TaxID=1131731 RepID=K6D7J3_SCHAZ|nr:ABC transporter ATP-binding protein [Schinkia azotoformans]EKN64284.1 cobalt ABC transporter ATP-binding protein [Schinkia azotoformans LMG 9581]MEC1638007.1 ABC transporter ATP-binding protein [Schinkia azotoformans]MEC1721561.1 ABC transporter ATP-binding protein [Schinkia azotoformans]MEC1944904.1 ABC transporter ATP-binding protein [Schinkia azotoformans]MED4413640.1 ABC transporter ATP-binding protein [Schinkia azotoformans]
MTSLLELKNITFAYSGNGQPALQNFSIKIPRGKRCALLGHNGSGKSTVLLLVNGLLKPNEGKMLWKGEPIEFKRKSLKDFRQKTGLLFQNADEMLISPTVLEDISYGLISAGYKGEALQNKVGEILKRYQLDHLKDRPIHHLSLGEKRRVALAGIMGLEPDLLLMDEPTTYLDPSQTEVFLKEMNRIHHSGTTVVMSTHDLDLAYEWADWIFVIEKGQLIFEGTPDELFVNERFVLEKGLSIPLFFQLKQLFGTKNASKEEVLLLLKGLLGKKGDS